MKDDEFTVEVNSNGKKLRFTHTYCAEKNKWTVWKYDYTTEQTEYSGFYGWPPITS